jgi:ATP-binding cassette subfamily C (CFTR/MRP) protein 1
MDSENNFGPHRVGVFDFTILFEQSILSLLPSVLFLLLVPFRLFVLRNNERAVELGALLWLKSVSTLQVHLHVLTY